MGWKLIVAFLLFAGPGYATVHVAGDCERDTVNDLIGTAPVVNGDTVQVPAGTCNWGTIISVTKAITLIGAGFDAYDPVTGRPVLGTGRTIIYDDITGTGRLMTWTLVANLNSRLSGFEFRDGTRSSPASSQFGFIGQAGGGVLDSRRFRFDHNTVDHLLGLTLHINTAMGVIDHNHITGASNIVYVFTTNDWAWADRNWNAATNFGAENAVFVENNYLARDTSTAVMDAYGGARYVARFNTVVNGHFDAHGTESAGRARGTRMIEVYGNTMTDPTRIANLRSGAALVYNNTVTSSGTPNSVAMDNERTLGPNYMPWLVADGTSPWDNNNPGNPIASFTATAGSAGKTATVAGAGWTIDEWRGHVLKKTGACTVSASVSCSGQVISNTATTITISDDSGVATEFQDFADGDTFDLNLITEVLDAPGRSGGTLLVRKATSGGCTSVGTTATCTITAHGWSNGDIVGVDNVSPSAYTGTYQISNVTANTFDYTFAGGVGAGSGGGATRLPVGWNDQVDDPVYEWNNVLNGVTNMQVGVNSLYAWDLQIREGEHYFNDTEAPGYTPYTYPHPLIPTEITPGTDGLTAPRGLTRVNARLRVRRVVR